MCKKYGGSCIYAKVKLTFLWQLLIETLVQIKFQI